MFSKVLFLNRFLNRENIAFFSCLLMIVGLILSRFMITLGMILLIANAVINPNVLDHIKRFSKDHVMIIITSLFFLYLLSGIYSDNLEFYAERLRIKLPFLILPFAFSSIPISKKRFFYLMYIFLFIITLSSLGSLFYYMLNYEVITHSYKYAKVLPTPINHIRFSLMAAFAVIIGIYLYFKDVDTNFKFKKYFLLATTLFLFCFLHVLSVRSGLLVLYAALIYLIIWYCFIAKKVFLGVLALLSILMIPIVAYYSIPSFQNKFNYTKYEIEQYRQKQDKAANLSDTKRIVSIKAGMEIALNNPIIGTGIGDIQDDVKGLYQKNYPEILSVNQVLPHNQFLFIFAGTGLIGLIWFLCVFLCPLVINQNYKHPLFFSFNLMIFISFLVESTIETQIGTALYILFLLLGLSYLQKQRDINNG